jgi:hypothetical protein
LYSAIPGEFRERADIRVTWSADIGSAHFAAYVAVRGRGFTWRFTSGFTAAFTNVLIEA